jgi:Tol biopolymer transport system component
MSDLDLDRRLGALDAIDAPDLWSRATSTTPRHPTPSRGGWGRGAAIGTAFVVSLTSLAFVFFAFERGDQPLGAQRENGPFVVAASGLEGRPPQYDSLFVVDLDGTGLRRISRRVRLSQPDWSPDGAKIAFVGSPPRGAGDIYVMDGGGSNVASLTRTPASEGSPAWSPDGTRIVFARDSDVWVMRADGTQQTRLTELGDGFASSPTWSPDGTRIAFVRPFIHGISSSCPSNTATGVFLMDADGSDLHRITIGGCRGSIAWSPTSDSVAIWDEGRISLIDPDGELLRTFKLPAMPPDRIGFGTAGPVWSPDGRLLAFSLQGDVWTLRPNTGEWTQVTRDTGFAITDLDWGPAPPTEPPPDPEGLLVLQRNDRAWTFEEGVTSSLGVVEPWDIDPSGRIVAFRSDQIWYSAPGTTNSVSFSRRDAVLVMDPSTERPVVLDEAAPNETFDGPARSSPDGGSIALRIVSYPDPLPEQHPGANSGRAAVCLISTADGSRKCFPEAGHAVSLDWSADGRRILLAGLAGPVSILDVRTGALEQLVDPSGGAEAERLLREHGLGLKSVTLAQAWWSSSDRYVAADAAAIPGGSVPIIYSNEGEAVAVGSASNDAMPMAWSPSEDVLAYAVADASLATGGSSSVHLLDPASGDRVVADLSGTRAGGVLGMTWSPDGRLLALSTFEGTWLLDPGVGVGSLQRLDLPGAVVAWR